MIVPSLSCQAGCKYCFGPHCGAMMELETAKETVRFIHSIADELKMTGISVIFHGGEPLLAPYEVWETLLKGLSDSLAGIPVSLNVQSNLWRLDDRFLELFRKFRVSIGTSLDGPEEICDLNRGEGYYGRTMQSVRKAQAASQNVGAIATLTRQTLPHAEEILRFFRDLGINPVLHAAVRRLNQGESVGPDAEDLFSLTPEEYADAVIGLYPWYVRNRKYFSVSTLDHYCRAVVQGDPGVCTMQECLGMFLAISATGDITSCQRLTGREEFRLGSIFDRPHMSDLMASAAWKRLEARQEEVSRRCAGCGWIDVCKGGCYYNALSTGDGVIDPLCPATKRIYDFLQDRVMEEIGQEENLAAMQRPAKKDENPLLRSGPYISLAQKPHPSVIASNARRILAAYALGKFSDVDAAARYMIDSRISANLPATREALAAMDWGLRRETAALNNCYIHTTFRCNLHCTHCYAYAGDRSEEMPVSRMETLAEQALAMKFRQLIITGGEPLFHRERAELIRLCGRLKGRGSNIVLRSNLTGEFSREELREIALAFDQVVVSIDGNEGTHDLRRGKGSYASAVTNCRTYAEIAADIPGSAELSLACVMSAADINGRPGQSVRELGDRLSVKRVRFRPLLPLGRAAESDEPPFCECINQHEPIEEILRAPFTPMMSCGIGQNVYICPDGKAYPCYAWQTELSYLGNVLEGSLADLLAGPRFTRLRSCTVETIEKCRDCELRYLCGGACRAWGNREATDPNTAPPECGHLQKRSRELIAVAEKYLRT
ncbi:MAG: radical SAM protein [Oscillospiraceae bacterium]|nr:radical SAM protein [Oscillospiraceae bacterium]